MGISVDKRTYQDRKDYFKEYYRSYYENNPDYRKQQRERAVAKGIENTRLHLESVLNLLIATAVDKYKNQPQ